MNESNPIVKREDAAVEYWKAEAKRLQAENDGLRAVRDALVTAHERRGAILTAACGDNEAVILAWKTIYPEYYADKDVT